MNKIFEFTSKRLEFMMKVEASMRLQYDDKQIYIYKG